MDELQIRETIVVEGRDDEAAVLRAVKAGVLCTHGWGLPQENLNAIRSAYERQGIIILTDPDHAGRKIRDRLTALFPDAKQAYLVPEDAEKVRGGVCVDIGVENASPGAIRRALTLAKAEPAARSEETPGPEDLAALGLTGRPDSAQRRSLLGRELGIGACNAKTFCRRLRAFGITREELAAAWRRISQENR